MEMLSVKELSVQFGDNVIVNKASFSVSKGEWLMIVGPNGAGKSTIVSAISGGAPFTGEALLEGKNVKKYRPKELAKKMGVLSQNHIVSYSFTVEEVVRLGRYAYSKGIFGALSDEDKSMVEYALKETGMDKQREQTVTTLSGGELQRTFLAQLLAQDPEVLILDEPTNHLDLIYQKQVFALIRQWIKHTGKTVISVVHDLSLAKAFGTKAILLNQGEVFSAGEVSNVLSKENLEKVYEMDVYGWMNDMLSLWNEEK